MRDLDRTALASIAVCDITTNHCGETTARMGANLGYEVLFALDATHTFDRTGPDGERRRADEPARVTATSTKDLV
jgi:nicotinamidase-related amidase